MIDHPAPSRSVFVDALQASAGKLTPTENTLVAHLLTIWEDLPLLKANEIAQDVGVNPSSVTRLAQTLGYRGYPDMQRRVRQELRARHVPQPLPQASRAQVHWDREVALLNRMRHFSDAALDALAEDMAKAKRVYVAGAKGSAASALYSFHLWQTVRADVFLLPEDAVQRPALWLDSGKDDLLVAFTMRRHATVTARLISALVNQGTRLAVITDHPLAPEARTAAHVLLLPVGPEDSGQFVPITLSGSLSLLLASKLIERVGLDRVTTLEHYTQEHDLYSF